MLPQTLDIAFLILYNDVLANQKGGIYRTLSSQLPCRKLLV